MSTSEGIYDASCPSPRGRLDDVHEPASPLSGDEAVDEQERDGGELAARCAEQETRVVEDERQHSALRTALKTALQECVELRASRGEQETELASLREVRDAQERELLALREERSEEQHELAALRADQSEHEEELAKLRAERSKQQEEIEMLRAERSKQEVELKALRAERTERQRVVDVARKVGHENAALVKKNAQLQQVVVRSEELRLAQRRERRARAPGERMMRRKFAEKVEELSLTHARTTARMLNVQKRCFEEELESLESEAHATVVAFERQYAALREDASAKEEEYARDREAAYAKTAAVMAAVRRRIQQGDKALARAAAERQAAIVAAKERHAALSSLAADAGSTSAELTKARDALERKDRMLQLLRDELLASDGEKERLRQKVDEMDRKLAANSSPNRGIVGGGERTIDAEKLSKLFASVIVDVAGGGGGSNSGVTAVK